MATQWRAPAVLTVEDGKLWYTCPYLRLADQEATFKVPLHFTHLNAEFSNEVFADDAADTIDLAAEAARVVLIFRQAEERTIRWLISILTRPARYSTVDCSL